MLQDFDMDYVPSTHKTVEVHGGIEERLTVALLPSQSATHMLKDTSTWEWSELRDYVVSEIERVHGLFPRDAKKEAAIFKSFMSRYGSQAVAIAQFAFGPMCNGMWKGAPISVQRFCKGSDLYFGDLIIERL